MNRTVVVLVFALLLALGSGVAGAPSAHGAAQGAAYDGAAAKGTAEQGVSPASLTDFRGKLMLAYSLVFVAIIFYLVQSHRRSRALSEELRFLEERLASLERGPRGDDRTR